MSQHSLLSIKKEEKKGLEIEKIPLIENLTIKSIKTGKNFILLLTNNGLLFGYGNNNNGELGLDEQFVNKFTQIPNLENKIKVIECGYECSFIVDELNQLYFTGSTHTLFYKEEKKFTFTKIVTDKIKENIKFIRVAYDVLFIVTENNLLYVRGRNDGGQLGLGHNNTVFNFFVNSSLQHVNIKDLKCADFHSIVLDDNGIVYSCGHYLNSKIINNSNNFYFKTLDFLQSKIKFISVTGKHSILYSHNNELIIIDHYKTSLEYSVINVPQTIELKSIYSNNSSGTYYSALVTKENKIYIHKNNGLLLDDNNKMGDFYRLDDSVLLNSLNLPYLYVIGNGFCSMVVIYTDYLINEELDDKHLKLFFVRLKNQLLFDYKNSFIDIEFII